MHSNELHLDYLGELLERGDGSELRAWLEQLSPGEGPRYLTRLEENGQKQLLELLPAENAAQLLKEMPIGQAAELLKHLAPARAAELFEQFPSNEQADLVAELGEARSLVLRDIAVETARRAELLSQYSPDTAGGLMVAELLRFRENASVADVIDELRAHAKEYARLQAQYAYIVDDSDRLIGVLRLRDLLLLDHTDPLSQVMSRDPVRVPASLPLDELLRLFDKHPFFGIPVVDAENHLLGVALRADIEEASSDRSERRWLVASGVIGGEEIRSMSWSSRVLLRAPWLAVSLLLSMAAASVIGWYEETLASAIALSVFLPVISGMGGNSGNQALAVSIRELSLGLVQPQELVWVVMKEATVGLISGLLLAVIVAVLAWVWQRSIRLSAVVGIAVALNTLVAACLGGIVPLVLKRWRLDPALASGPVLSAVTDLCGFLFALTLADGILPHAGQ